jgi:ubiquinone/menaquinone biosynthesis C-methylase UbiE
MEDLSSESVGFLDPEKIVRSFELERGDYAADFGAGHGYFSIPMAKIVGADGKVYAIDIQKATLEVIKTKAQLEHLLNIETIWGNLDEHNGSKLKNGSVDFAAISNVLFQADHKDVMLGEARRILRAIGRIAVIEWVETPTRIGPPPAMRLKKEETKNLAQVAGFEFLKEFDAGKYHYGLLFRKL